MAGRLRLFDSGPATAVVSGGSVGFGGSMATGVVGLMVVRQPHFAQAVVGEAADGEPITLPRLPLRFGW